MHCYQIVNTPFAILDQVGTLCNRSVGVRAQVICTLSPLMFLQGPYFPTEGTQGLPTAKSWCEHCICQQNHLLNKWFHHTRLLNCLNEFNCPQKRTDYDSKEDKHKSPALPARKSTHCKTKVTKSMTERKWKFSPHLCHTRCPEHQSHDPLSLTWYKLPMFCFLRKKKWDLSLQHYK